MWQLLQVMISFWLSMYCVQVSSVTFVPECLRLSGSRTSAHPLSNVLVPMATPPKTCGHLGCYLDPMATVGLGHTKWATHKHTLMLEIVIWVFPNVVSAERISCGITSNVCDIITTIFPLSSALLQVWRCVQTEAPAFRGLAEQTDGDREGPAHLVQPCTQLVHQCDHARWAEPHRGSAALCRSPVSQGVSHSCCVGLCCHGVPGSTSLQHQARSTDKILMIQLILMGKQLNNTHLLSRFFFLSSSSSSFSCLCCTSVIRCTL